MPCVWNAERSGISERRRIPPTATDAPDVKGEDILHITEMTLDKLYEVGSKKLIPGKTVRVRSYAKRRDGRLCLRSQRKGTITELYKYFFVVDIGGFRECFRYNQMFGTEEVRVHP